MCAINDRYNRKEIPCIFWPIKQDTMIRIWIFVVLTCGAIVIAQEADLDDLFNYENGANEKHSGVYGDLDKGCHDCYKCDDERVTSYPRKTSKLRLVDARGHTTKVCCLAQLNLAARIGDNCGKIEPSGIILHGKKQKKTHVRATLVGEYPWRVWIWKKGESRPFCGGTVVDTDITAVVTSASCALKHPVGSLVMTFYRTLESAVDVGERVVHPEYFKGEPFVNDIALLFRDTSEQGKAAKWVKPACTSSLPPLQTTYCKVMSKEDYFIDTVVLEQKKCEVGRKKSHVSQMCTAIVKGDYEPEIGAGLFCQDRLRTETKDYYASGITLQVSDQMIAYTNVSHFEQWIKERVAERVGGANPAHYSHGY